MFESSRVLSLIVGVSSLTFLSAADTAALESVAIGWDGDLDWQGNGSATVETFDAEYLAPPDPNNPGGTPQLLIGNAPGDLVEFDSADFPQSLLPQLLVECPDGTCPEANVAAGTISRGGRIRIPTFSSFTLQYKSTNLKENLEEMISSRAGGEEDALELKNFNAFGQLLILDMGARFPVNRIRFYPRNSVQKSPATPFQNDFLRAYELFTNDGLNLTREGNQIWNPLVLERDNRHPVVDVRLDPPRYVRSIRMKSLTQFDWEIDEFEVYGQGFLPTASYISDIFDAGGPATWIKLRWDEEIVGDPDFSQMQIRTRTGIDDSPFVFTRTLRGKPNAEEIPFSVDDPTQDMTRREFESLPKIDADGREWEPASVLDDLVNWSPFSTPFAANAANGPGSPIVSPSPRRYFQFQVFFDSKSLDAARVLRSLGFEFLVPPLADELIGEIFPRRVEPSTSVSFIYAVRPVMHTTGLLGFDTIEIYTPTQVESIDRIEILDAEGQMVASRDFADLSDRTLVDDFQITAVANDRFSVRLPLIQEDGTQARIFFRTSVLTYSTNFPSAALISTEPDAAQGITSGEVAVLGEDDRPDFSGITVLSPKIQEGSILARVELGPNPFTPNGDGVNDVIGVNYSLLSLSVPRPVYIGVYDLAGRSLRVLHEGPERNGRYEDKGWDGRDDAGALAAPGIYIVRIEVVGDAETDVQSRVVALVY